MRIYALNHDQSNNSIEPQLLRTLKPHQAPVVVSTIDSTGTLLATGGADGIVKVWDIKGGYVTHTFHGHSGLISALHFFQVNATSLPKETQSGKKRKKPGQEEVDNIEDEGTTGFRLASGGEDGKVRIWNLQKRKSVAILDSHVSVVRKLDYSAEENALLSTSRDKTLMVWDITTWKNRHTIPVLEELETAGFLENGAILYTGGENGNVRLWLMTTGKELTKEQLPKSETEAIQDSIYYPSLEYLVTVHADQTLVLHDLRILSTQENKSRMQPLSVIRRICGNYDQIVDLAYVGPDKTLLAVNSNSEDIRIISLQEKVPSDTDRRSFFGGEVGLLKGHEDIIVAMDVDWSGHWLATGAKDNNARLWCLDPALNSFTCYATLTGHAESIAAVALPHNTPQKGSMAYEQPLNHPPTFMITGSSDKTIKRWSIPTLSTTSSKAQIPRASYTLKAHEKDINAVSIHPSSKLFASASQDRLVKIWTVEDGSTVGILRGHRRGVWTVAFSPPGIHLDNIASGSSGKSGYVLTGSGDQTVRLWSLSDYTCILTLDGHTNSVLKVLWFPPPIPQSEEILPNDKRGPLVASSSADKLVKVWDLTASSCAATLDGHDDRVWALATRPPDAKSQPSTTLVGEGLVSGAADGVLTFWRDTTALTAAKARQEEEKRVETDQRLSNLIHGQNWREAIVLALQLDQPGRLLALFKKIGEADVADPGSLTGSVEVDAVIASLSDDQLYRLLLRCRDWNTNARNALIAQRVLGAVVRTFGREKLAALKTPRGGLGLGDAKSGRASSVAEILDGLRVWTERHYERMSDLWDESFMVEFVLGEMDGLGGIVNGNELENGHAQDGIALVNVPSDITMME
jgi:U3 small nucleolar RNA-associated protein 13